MAGSRGWKGSCLTRSRSGPATSGTGIPDSPCARACPPSTGAPTMVAMDQGTPRGDGGASVEVARRAAAGDREAFAELYRRHHDGLLLTIRCRLSPGLRVRLTSEDVLQSVMADVLSDIARFEPRGSGSLARWLHTAALNKIRNRADHFAAGRRAGDVSLTDSLLVGLGGAPDAAPEYMAPERWEPLERALSALPEEMREAVVLRTLEGLSNEQAARELDKSPAATSKLYNRALARLGTRLAGLAPP